MMNNFETRRTEITNIMSSFGWQFCSELERDVEGLWSIDIDSRMPSGELFDATVFFDGTVPGFISGVKDAADEFELEELVTPKGVRIPSEKKETVAKCLIEGLADDLEGWLTNSRKKTNYLSERIELQRKILNCDFSDCSLAQLRAANEILSGKTV